VSEPLYTAEEMKAAEAGHDVDVLMERAARAVADTVLERFPSARRIRAVCGKGANGGDGRIAARMLREAGLDAEESTDLDGADLVVDALFGTGFSGAPRPEAAELIGRINEAGVPVVAVDIPSGVDASTGEVPGEAVEAELTVTMHGLKVGLAVGPGCLRAGEVVVADIRLEPRPTRHALVGSELLARVPAKREGDNKYTAGSVLVVGGSRGMTGASGRTPATSRSPLPRRRCPCSRRSCSRRSSGRSVTPSRPPRRRGRSRSGPAWVEGKRSGSSSAACCSGRTSRPSWTPTASTGSLRSYATPRRS